MRALLMLAAICGLSSAVPQYSNPFNIFGSQQAQPSYQPSYQPRYSFPSSLGSLRYYGKREAEAADLAHFAGIPVMRSPDLSRQAKMAQLQDIDRPSYGNVGAANGPSAYGPPAAAPHAGPDHVDYGAYTGGNGAFGWYTDQPVLLGPDH